MNKLEAFLFIIADYSLVNCEAVQWSWCILSFMKDLRSLLSTEIWSCLPPESEQTLQAYLRITTAIQSGDYCSGIVRKVNLLELRWNSEFLEKTPMFKVATKSGGSR